MIRTYKYKLYKTKRAKNIHNTINISGIIYNHCIALHKRYYRLYGKHLNKFQLQKHLTKLKKKDKYSVWIQVPSQAIQNITERIDNAYKKFFDYTKGKTKLRVGPPTFKAVKKYRSYTLKGKVGYKIEDNVISLNGYRYKFWKSRPIDGTIKTVIIKRDNLGDFYICITIDKKETKLSVATGKSVGIDFGMITFLTLDDTSEVESPMFHLKYLKELRTLNRDLSKKKKGSEKRKQAKRKLAKLHIKIANSRKDYFHKLTNQLALNYDNIFMEDLNMKAMQMMWGRKISDLAFSEFVNILEYKTNVIKIDRFYPSSKTCSECGYVLKELDLKKREWTCPSCQAQHLRDVNAAINIKRVGTSALRGETVRATSVA
ncbi:MAG: RNA-guided endonuclease TnpB family protein [Sulfurovum sp.]|uniref:RNA-guided endonuclease InsQ/TnpB family protein n=1 Tax=Sulfurovum sp. TaxID=1969726 RepID=UPI003C7120A2